MIELAILFLLLIGIFGSLASVLLIYVNRWRTSFSLILVFSLLALGSVIAFSSVALETTTKEIKVEQLKKGRSYNAITDENGILYKVETEVIYRSGIIPVYEGDTLLIKTTHLKNDKDLSDNMWEMVE